jgi:hypothetical protein
MIFCEISSQLFDSRTPERGRRFEADVNVFDSRTLGRFRGGQFV